MLVLYADARCCILGMDLHAIVATATSIRNQCAQQHGEKGRDMTQQDGARIRMSKRKRSRSKRTALAAAGRNEDKHQTTHERKMGISDSPAVHHEDLACTRVGVAILAVFDPFIPQRFRPAVVRRVIEMA